MIISCQNCRAAFVVAPEQIGVGGRRVKCSKCKNIWYATIPLDAFYMEKTFAEPSRIDPVRIATANLPVIISAKISKMLLLAPFFMLALIAMTLLTFYPTIMNKFGLCEFICEPYGVKIQDVTYNYDEAQQKIMVEYSIANNTLKKAKLPIVEIKLIDSNNEVQQKTYIENNDIWLDANGSVKAKTEFNSISPYSKFVRIALGNKIKFLFR